jgi:hypothetical protein
MCNCTCFSKTLTIKCPDYGIQTRSYKGRCDVEVVTRVFRFPRPVFLKWRFFGISLYVVLWEESVVSIVRLTEFSSSESNSVTLKMEATRSFETSELSQLHVIKRRNSGYYFTN